MPYDPFNSSAKYNFPKGHPLYAAQQKVRKEAEEKVSKVNRRKKPPHQWSVRDVVLEFRQRYNIKYPMHSPDELGSYPTLFAILSRHRNNGVPVEHMVWAIDEFWRKSMDIRYPNVPAWKRFMWLVLDVREKDPDLFRAKQEKAAGESAIQQQGDLPHSNEDQVQASLQIERDQRRLARKRMELERLLEDQRRYGDLSLLDELGDNWANLIEEMKEEVGFHEPHGDGPTG